MAPNCLKRTEALFIYTPPSSPEIDFLGPAEFPIRLAAIYYF
jgi:hypothetical protein